MNNIFEIISILFMMKYSVVLLHLTTAEVPMFPHRYSISTPSPSLLALENRRFECLPVDASAPHCGSFQSEVMVGGTLDQEEADITISTTALMANIVRRPADGIGKEGLEKEGSRKILVHKMGFFEAENLSVLRKTRAKLK